MQCWVFQKAYYYPVCFADNPGLVSHVPVVVRILDVNDNPPELARDYDVVVCENTKPGQVTLTVMFFSVITIALLMSYMSEKLEHVIILSDFILAFCICLKF